MICRLHATKITRTPAAVDLGYTNEVTVGGVVYAVNGLNLPEFCTKQHEPDSWPVMVHTVYREGEPLLFGFLDSKDRLAFVDLLKVPKVGPRTAMNILRRMGVHGVKAAIEHQRHEDFTAVRGVGAKMAKALCGAKLR